MAKVLAAKEGWVDIGSLGPTFVGAPNFKWTPCSVKTEFAKLTSDKTLYNHFEYHKEITRKNDLFTNLSNNANYLGENVFDLVPVTFHVFVSAGRVQENLDVALKKFEYIFQALEKGKNTAVAETTRAAVRPVVTAHLQPFEQVEKRVIHKQSLRNQFPRYCS